MRFKLDENLGTRTVGLFVDRGHDVATVHSQGMWGASDQQLYGACVREGRILVTLDREFAKPFRFDAAAPGIVVFRVSETPGLGELAIVGSRLLDTVGSRDPVGRLWIVDLQRVRAYRPPEPRADEYGPKDVAETFRTARSSESMFRSTVIVPAFWGTSGP